MRLINCTTFALEEPPESSIPPYAILSHRWDPDKEQVTYQDFLAGEPASAHKDWAKIHGACKFTARNALNHVWIDTCCFDKTSSAEMSETINSMFRWYANARVCAAYLSDYDSSVPRALDGLGGSGWFYRGWTLQELIAPPHVEFFDCNWVYFGKRRELAAQLSAITGIDEGLLSSENPGELLPAFTVAKRMSWAARRQTTRLEDRAYSLLGIFGVHIPMLYGEGERAFIRLQEEILKESNDLTLFAWKAASPTGPNTPGKRRCRGVLARSPSEFADAGHLVLRQDAIFNPEHTLTNKGLRIDIVVQRFRGDGVGFLNLNCLDQRSTVSEPLGIFLKAWQGNTYVRYGPHELEPMARFVSNTVFEPAAYIAKDMDIVESALRSYAKTDETLLRFDRIRFNMTRGHYEDMLITGHPRLLWNKSGNVMSFETAGFAAFTGYVRMKQFTQESHAIIACGFEAGAKPWVCVTKPGEDIYDAAMAGNFQDLTRMCPRMTVSRKTCEIKAYTAQPLVVVKASVDPNEQGPHAAQKEMVVNLDHTPLLSNNESKDKIRCLVM